MKGLSAWGRGKRGTFTGIGLTVAVALPVMIAVMHDGYPVSAVDLKPQDVWVTAESSPRGAMAGRLNAQIEELNGSFSATDAGLDVFQEGTTLFVATMSIPQLQRVDPAFTKQDGIIDALQLPARPAFALGNGTLSILDLDDGRLFLLDARRPDFSFDTVTAEPALKLGPGAAATITKGGVVFAVSAAGTLYRFDNLNAEPRESNVPALGRGFQLSAVGDRAVILDVASQALITQDGKSYDLSAYGPLKLQQPGDPADVALVSTGNGLLRVQLGSGEVENLALPAGSRAATSPETVAAPVQLLGCDFAAWSEAGAALRACAGEDPGFGSLQQHTAGDPLVYRVNGSVIVLNNIRTGRSYLPEASFTLVDNWDAVTPPEEQEETGGEQKATVQSFEDAIATRKEDNTRPKAVDDDFGARSGTSTVLAVLDNDSDQDGDVLVVTATTPQLDPETQGVLELIDDGRALQFTPAPGAAGTVVFRYTVSDGRPDGTAEAEVRVAIRSEQINNAPIQFRSPQVSVDATAWVTYNVFADWRDPDGDTLRVTSAVSNSGDAVRFTPDGFITFTHTSGKLGVKEVTYTISDGRVEGEGVTGTLSVQVNKLGTTAPIGNPDFVRAIAGRQVLVEPLANDISRNGEELRLLAVEDVPQGIVAKALVDKGAVSLTGYDPGVYYIKYALQTGSTGSYGLIRLDVEPDPDSELAPIAVKDTAYLRPDEPLEVSVLANDMSPSGRVLAIQSVSVPPESSALSVEVLGSSRLRISASEAVTELLHFEYTVSDGISASTTSVTVVPVPRLTRNQAPVAADDRMTVRVGDIATVDVLANDYHPDGVAMYLAADLLEATPGEGGLVFVSGNTVRFQAPEQPGTYTARYQVLDQYNQSDSAMVIFTVTGFDDAENQAPLPMPLTARVFAEAQIKIDVPLNGIDPDGDSVTLAGVSGMSKGSVIATGDTWFVYQAVADSGPGSLGTDEFRYEVQDAQGARSVGTVRVAVVPRPGMDLPPVANVDVLELLPGARAAVDVLANDSDPNGHPISVVPELSEVPEGVTAEVQGNLVLLTAPQQEGVIVIGYTLTNGRGGTAPGWIQIKVTEDARPQHPTAVDQVINVKDVIGEEVVLVEVLRGAQNPSGLPGELEITLDGVGAAHGTLGEGGVVEVALGERRQAIGYTLTDTVTGLGASAFIVVPPYTSSLPPRIRPDLNDQIVSMNGSREWKLEDILEVPSGGTPRLTSPDRAEGVTAVRADPDAALFRGESTLLFTAARDYRGEASLTFLVTDDLTEPVWLTLPITVGDPGFYDVPPSFTAASLSFEGGEEGTLDLRAATNHPNRSVIGEVTYGGLKTSGSSAITARISGAQLTVTAPRDTPVGTKATVGFTLSFRDLPPVAASVEVTVVASTRPRAILVKHLEPDGRRNSSYTFDLLQGAWNPFGAGEPLQVESVEFVQNTIGATFSGTGSTRTVYTGAAKHGVITLVYRVLDATRDRSRMVQETVELVVASEPEPPRNAAAGTGDRLITVSFDAPISSNNQDGVSGYRVRLVPASGPALQKTVATSGPVSFTSADGVINGVQYTINVYASNEVGESLSSNTVQVTPYGDPVQVTGVSTPSGGYATTALTFSWTGLGTDPDKTGGGDVRYQIASTSGASCDGVVDYTTGWGVTSYTTGSTFGAGSYRYCVRAENRAGKLGPWSAISGAKTVQSIPITNVGPYGTSQTFTTSSGNVCTGQWLYVWYDGFSGTRASTLTDTASNPWAGQATFNVNYNGSPAKTSWWVCNGSYNVRFTVSGVDYTYTGTVSR